MWTMCTIKRADDTQRRRFEVVAYPRTLKAAKDAFRAWHSRKRDDAVAECVAKMWDSWTRLLDRGKDPMPMMPGLIKFAILWVHYDRRVAGRAPHPDVFDYRSGLKRQQLSGRGQASPTDRADRENGRIEWTTSAGDDPAELAAALESFGLRMDALAGD